MFVKEVHMNNKFKCLLTLGGFIMTVVMVGVYLSVNNKGSLELSHEVAAIPLQDDCIAENQEDKTSKIFVYVLGAVKEPGVVIANENSRLYEVIALAGGATEEADLNRVNLASMVKDEQKIVIPFKMPEECGDSLSVGFISSNNYDSLFYSIYSNDNEDNDIGGVKRVNINTANESALITLKGIGSATAKNIIRYREENGKFLSIDDIKKVSGIGESKFEKMKDE